MAVCLAGCAAAPPALRGGIQPPPPAAPFELKGHGNQVTPVFSLQPGLTVFTTKHAGGLNFVVVLESGAKYLAVLANALGPAEERAAYGVTALTPAFLYVQADGDWDVQFSQAPRVAESDATRFCGSGQGISPIFSLPAGPLRFAYHHDGLQAFDARLFGTDGRQLAILADVIGPVDDSQTVDIPASGTYALTVVADGNWDIGAGDAACTPIA